MRGCRSPEKTKAKLGLSLTGRKAKIGFAKLKFSKEKSCGLVPTQVQILFPALTFLL